jgi:DNA-3-methyladenine glycosylase
VLIRAIEPVAGVDLMRRRRGGRPDAELANGPAKLCEAMGITGAQDGVRLHRDALWILAGARVPDDSVLVSPRIGITKARDWPLRYKLRAGS